MFVEARSVGSPRGLDGDAKGLQHRIQYGRSVDVARRGRLECDQVRRPGCLIADRDADDVKQEAVAVAVDILDPQPVVARDARALRIALQRKAWLCATCIQ